MFGRRFVTTLALACVFTLAASVAQAQMHTSRQFSGAKVNGGTVTHSVKDGRHVLTLSPDFQVPDTPDPHWQVVDAKGNIFLLQRLGVKNGLGLVGDKINRAITLPSYIGDIAKVQIYCAWAETVLGETAFENTLTTASK